MSQAGPSGGAAPVPGAARPLAGTYFALFAVTGVLLPFLPPYLESLGLGAADVGALLAVMTATRIVMPALWAYLADRSGAALVIIRAGLAGALAAASALALVSGFWPLAAVLAVHGLFATAVMPQVETLTLGSLGPDAQRYGRIRLWGSVGFILAVLAGGATVERFGIGVVPLALVGLQAAALLATIRLGPLRARRPPADGAHGALVPALRQPAVLAFLLAAGLMAAGHGPYYAFFSIHLDALGYAASTIGVLWAFAVVVEIGAFALMPQLLARFSLSALFVACTLATALRWLALGNLAGTPAALVAAQTLHAASFALFHAAAMEFVRTRFPAAAQARGQALYSALGFGLGGAAGAWAAGLSWQAGGPQLAYGGAALASSLAGLVLWAGLRATPARQAR